MNQFRATTIERAYQIAREGRVRTLTEIKKQLKEEGFGGILDLQGSSLSRDLARLCRAARQDGVP